MVLNKSIITLGDGNYVEKYNLKEGDFNILYNEIKSELIISKNLW